MHLILCHGPIDSITRIEIGKKIAWRGYSTGGSIFINAPDLFGGDEREGGIKGTIDIAMGESGQVQNSYLVAVLGSLVPAYRRLVGVVMRAPYLGTSPYLKPWSFRGTRILKSSDGALQWYDNKATIVVDDGQGDFTEYFTSMRGMDLPVGRRSATSIIADNNGFVIDTNPNALVQIYPQAPVSGFNIASDPQSDGTWKWVMTVSRDDNPSSLVTFDSGSFSTPAAALAQAQADGPYQLTGNSRYRFWVNLENFTSALVPENGGLTARITTTVNQRDMNAVHIIRESLTDKEWGMGYNAADIDDTVFQAAADVLFTEKFGISLVWDRSMNIESFIEEVLRHIDASLFVSRRTGKWNIKLIRNDYVVASLLTLGPTNISSVTNPNRVAFGELSNSVTVKFWDHVTGNDDSVTVTDTALARIQQNQLINASVNYPGFTNKRNAIIAAQRDLRALSIGFFSCTIICDSAAEDLNIGSPFKFTWPEWEIYDMVMRVTGISFGDGRNNKIRITASEDIYSTSTNPQVSNAGSSWIDPSQPPGSIEFQISDEVPYYEAVQNFGQTSVDDQLTSNPNAGYVFSAAARPDGAINGRMWLDLGSGYEQSSILDFCPFGVVPALTPMTTTFFLTDFSDLDLVEIGSYAQIGISPNSEIVRIDDIDSDTGEVTIGRGCLDTTPKKFLSGVSMFFFDAYNAVDQTEYVSGETIDVKITSITGQGEFDVASAVPMSVTMANRATKPYAPGQFKINSEYYPDELPLDGSLTSTWVGRDRTQQTASVIYDHLFGNIGPEAGVTYRFRGYIDNVLITTVEPATSGNVWTPTAYEGLARIEIHSVRGGLYSFQPAMHEFLYTNADLQKVEDGDTIKKAEDSDFLKLRED